MKKKTFVRFLPCLLSLVLTAYCLVRGIYCVNMLKQGAKKISCINRKTCTKYIHNLVQKYIPDEYSNLSSKDFDSIENNVKLRQSNADVQKIRTLIETITTVSQQDPNKTSLLQKLKEELKKIPNDTHPDVVNIGDTPRPIQKFNEMPQFQFKPKSFTEITKKLNLLRMDHLGNLTGHKSYYFLDALAELENALVQYTIDQLKQHEFQLVSVPDILPTEIIEGCGMEIDGERTQVYKLTDPGKCLSGTSEMALVGYYANQLLNNSQLPLRLAAVSKCFRAETSGLQVERGIYRVHQFTKVEMVSVCTKDQSTDMLELFKTIEIDLYRDLGMHFQLLDMSPNELGAPAYRKYDIEAWMPGRNMWGEISSCSNCTNYQAKRLNIKYNRDGEELYAHTVNGTACATPRVLIAILERYQREDGTIKIPVPLQKYLHGKEKIQRRKHLPELKLTKHIPSPN